MTINPGLSFFAVSLVLGSMSSTTYATQVREIPELCFTTPAAYQAYVAAKKKFDAEPNNANYFEALKAEQLKPVTVEIKQSQASSGAPITLDASASKVTSGKITYLWSGFADREATLMIPPGSPGSSKNVFLTVVDELCGNSQPQQISVISK